MSRASFGITRGPVASLSVVYERTPDRTTPAAGTRVTFQTPGMTS
jgi:hypothetical protein